MVRQQRVQIRWTIWKCIDLHVKFDFFSAGNVPRPPNWGEATAPLPRSHPLGALVFWQPATWFMYLQLCALYFYACWWQIKFFSLSLYFDYIIVIFFFVFLCLFMSTSVFCLKRVHCAAGRYQLYLEILQRNITSEWTHGKHLQPVSQPRRWGPLHPESVRLRPPTTWTDVARLPPQPLPVYPGWCWPWHHLQDWQLSRLVSHSLAFLSQ